MHYCFPFQSIHNSQSFLPMNTHPPFHLALSTFSWLADLLSMPNRLKTSFYPFPLIKRNRGAPTCTTKQNENRDETNEPARWYNQNFLK